MQLMILRFTIQRAVMKMRLTTALILIAMLSPAVGFCYKVLSPEEIDDLKTSPERFAGLHLIIKDKVSRNIRRPSSREEHDGFDATFYTCFKLVNSGLTCLIRKSQLEKLSMDLDSMPHVIAKGVLVMKKSPRLGKGRTHERYYFKVEELIDDSVEVKTADWNKEDYAPVTFEALCLDMDAYVNKPVQLTSKVSHVHPLTMLSSCDKEMGITADEYLSLMVGHAHNIRFLIPKNDENLKKLKNVNFGDIKGKKLAVTFLLRGELKGCEFTDSKSGKRYVFIIHDLEEVIEDLGKVKTGEVKTGDWSKKDYTPVTFEALCMDMDAYVGKPLELSCRISQARPLTMLGSCEREMGIMSDEYLILLTGNATSMRFLLPKSDDNLKKIKGVLNFGDSKEKRPAVTFLLRGELKGCGINDTKNGKRYIFVIHDLEGT
ncbi:MAG: hypothetical protein NTZ78_10305 [Candidatus Aureabacteria bacterium]|nr:hypothetical protein [Candidatus Auribacterota bacterium]